MDNPRYLMHQGGERVRIHYHQPTTGILLPAGQAFMSGIFLGLPIGIIGKSWYLFWSSWAIIQAGAWLMLLWHWFDLTSRAEEMLGWDLNQDGYIGAPEPVQETVRVAVTSEDGRQTAFLDMPVDRARLALMASGVMSGVPLAESSWVGPGKFTRYEFTAVRDELIKRGYATWISEASKARGVRVTAKGRALLRGLAGSAALPSPTGQDSTHLSA